MEWQIFGEPLQEESSSWSFGTEPPTAQPTADQFAGRYELLDELGRGGYGVVHRARDLNSEREVALKVLNQGMTTEARKRFAREGVLTARLTHPGIVRVHAGGEEAGVPFLAYELVEGSSLKDALPRLPRSERLRIVLEVAEAVAYAHAQGVVHRDLKPANVLLDEEARPRVADFGLATTQDAERLTQSDAVVGTPAYMAPEAWTSPEPTGPPADVWALGTMLYECLTDRLPFMAASLAQVIHAALQGDYSSPSRMDPSVGPQLDRVVARALEPKIRARYPDARAFADALAAALQGELPVAPPRALVAVIAFTTLPLAGVVLALVLRPPPAAPVTPPPPAQPPPTASAPAEAPSDPLVAGQAALEAGEPQRALELFDRALAKRETARARCGRSAALLQLGRVGEALADAETALELEPENPWSYVARADARLAGEAFIEAQQDYTRAIDLAPDDVSVLLARARAYGRVNLPQMALDDLQRARQLAPESFEVCVLLAEMKLVAERDDAVEFFGKALELRPNSAFAHRGRARAHLAEGSWDPALDDLRRAHALDPELSVGPELERVALGTQDAELARQARELAERAP